MTALLMFSLVTSLLLRLIWLCFANSVSATPRSCPLDCRGFFSRWRLRSRTRLHFVDDLRSPPRFTFRSPSFHSAMPNLPLAPSEGGSQVGNRLQQAFRNRRLDIQQCRSARSAERIRCHIENGRRAFGNEELNTLKGG